MNNQQIKFLQALCADCNQPGDLIPFSSNDQFCQKCFDLRQQSLFIPIHQILDKLFLGSLQAIQADLLQEKQIKAICSCGRNLKQPKNVEAFTYKNIPVGDLPEQNILDYFEDFCKWVDERINKDQVNVLVHCAAGASRSASFVICYVMWNKKMKYHEALKFVFNIRRCVDPNDGFKKQLQAWQTILFKN